MILHFSYVGAALMALALIAAWMFIVSRRHVVARIFGAVAVLMLAVTIWVNVTALLGYPVAEMPTGKLQIAGMLIDVANQKIFLWVNREDGPRAYVVPFDEALAGGLVSGQQKLRKQGGGDMLLNFDQASHGRRFHIDLIPRFPAKE